MHVSAAKNMPGFSTTAILMLPFPDHATQHTSGEANKFLKTLPVQK